MAPPYRPRPLRKDHVPQFFKSSKMLVFSESARPSTLAPNIRSVAWSPTGALVAVSTSVNVRVWNPERPDVKASAEMKDAPKGSAHVSAVEKVAFNPRVDGVLASTGLDAMVKVWDVRLPGAALSVAAGGGGGGGGGAGGGAGGGGSIAVGPRGAVNSKAGELKLGSQGLFLTWHPTGTALLVGRKDDVVQAIDLRRADVVMDQSAGAAASTGGANKYELTATDRTPVKDEGSAKTTAYFNAMAFSHTGREVFATTSEGPVNILDYPSMQPIHSLAAHTSSTYAVQQSPVGNYVAIGASDSMITLWDTTSWLCSHVLTQHTSAVRDLSFSFDGAYLIAGSGADGPRDGDKGLTVYHVDTGEVVHTIDTVNAPTWVAWHPFRYAVAYAGDPGGLKVVGSLSGL